MVLIKLGEFEENCVGQKKIYQITSINLCKISSPSFNVIFYYNILYIVALKPRISQRMLLQNCMTLILK